ncbi:response regulator [Sediminicoccus sp. BL-A-41-H5]|uniref:response regulator n=1 Tax=Sediminicoccus sp. BL-A-41-H5 TaxID=3421106 RepID=UPI003D675D12
MLNVLIIEDEPVIGLLLRHLLAEMGHVCVGVEGTEAGAVAAAARLRPTLLLVDSKLRQGTGGGALRQILATGFVPHILMSGDSQAAATPAEPAKVRMRKPFTDRDLERAVAQATGVSSAARA